MKKFWMVGLVVIGVGLGAGVYHLTVGRNGKPSAEKPSPPPVADDPLDMATVRKVLIDIQTRPGSTG